MISRGNFILIEYLNNYYNHLVSMCLEYFDNENYDNCVVVLGSYVKQPIKEIRKKYDRKKIIIYQTEQLFGGNSWHSINKIIENTIGCDELWEFDILNIKFLNDYYGIKVNRFIPLRYTKSLDKKLDENKNHDIDLLFYGTINERRFKYIYNIQKWFLNELKIMTLIGFNHEFLDDCISRSKIILNLHPFEPYHRQEQVRLFYPVINGKCVITEVSQINHLSDCVVEEAPENLGKKIEWCLKNDNYLKIGKEAREKFKNYTLDNYDHHTNAIINVAREYHEVNWSVEN